MSTPETTEIVESPSEAGPAEAAPEQTEGQRMAAAWKQERPSLQAELAANRKAAEPTPPKDPNKALLFQIVEGLGEYASAKIDERDQAVAAHEEDSVVNWAQSTLTDWEAEPEEISAAADSLLDQVGVDDYRFGSFFSEWAESDPEAAQEWATQRQWTNHFEMEAAQQEVNEANAQAWDVHNAKMAKMTTDWANDHPDIPESYIAQMGRLAFEGGINLTGSPEEVKIALDGLYEALRNLDASAPPIRGAHNTGWETSVGWEANEGDKILNGGLGLRRRSESVDHFRARMAERGLGVHADGNTVYTPADVEAVSRTAYERARPGARLTHADWEAQEQARMHEAFMPRGDVQAQLHGPRDTKGRFAKAQQAAEAARPAGPAGGDDDPGGFWALTGYA